MISQDLERIVKSASDKMRTDDNTKGATKYLEQFAWLLFLKLLESVEGEEALAAEVDGKPYQYSIDAEHRWSQWADGDLTGNDLIDYVANDLLPYLRSDQRAGRGAKVAEVFNGVTTVMKSGYVFAEVIALINQVHFDSEADYHAFSLIYESLLAQLGREAGWSGEYYTPRPMVNFIVDVVAPMKGETVYDPCCGTCGFLVATYERLAPDCIATADLRWLREDALWGKESGELPFLLGTMNLMLHGVPSPRIVRENTLSESLRGIDSSQQFDIIVTNPPFGGKENPQVQRNFPFKNAATEALFLQHILAKLRNGGRAGLVVPEGLLYEATFLPLRERLIRECRIESIVRLPDGAFAPYSNVQTSIVFFTKGKPTEHIWFYEVQPPVGRQKFSKTRQINADDLADCRKLIGDRAVGDHSWIMSVQELGSDVLLAQRKPQTKDAPDLPKSMGLGGHLAELSKVAEMIAPTVADLAEKAAQLSRSSFDLVAVDSVLERVKRPVQLEDNFEYTQLTVQYWGRGVKLRQTLKGVAIKTKRQYQVRSGDLVVSRIDARFGAVGVVPPELDGAIISGDYWSLAAKEAVPVGVLFLALSSESGIATMRTASRGSTNRKRLDETLFMASHIAIPSDSDDQVALLSTFEDLGLLTADAASLVELLGSAMESLRGGELN
jgi:type I restriction enzyme M protein